MYFRTLALEEEAVIVLNYSPGGVQTDMLAEFETHTASNEVRTLMKQLHERNLILKPVQTTTKLIDIIENGRFKSGEHKRYYEWK